MGTIPGQFLFLALAVAAISFTISKSSMPVIAAARAWVTERSDFLDRLLHCPYCTSHWVALAAMLLYHPIVVTSASPVADWFVSWMALVGASMAPIFALYFVAQSK